MNYNPYDFNVNAFGSLSADPFTRDINFRVPQLPTQIVSRKFFGEQSDKRHPGRLTWPGYHGYPVLGQYFSIKREESHLVVPVRYFYSKVFDLSKKEDEEYYVWVMERVHNGWFKAVYIERKFLEDRLLIYVEWLQIYSVFPSDLEIGT